MRSKATIGIHPRNTALAIAFLVCASLAKAQTIVLNFDDLVGTTPGNPGNWTYQGFTFAYNNGPRATNCSYCTGSWYWSDIQSPNYPVFDQPWYKSPNTSLSTDFYTYPDGNPQDPNWPLSSSNWGESLGITRANPFLFDGAYFIALDDKQLIQVNGYLNGSMVAQSQMIQLNYNDGGMFLDSGFGNTEVDEIRVLSRQGFFAMDDFTYQEVLVPEPSSALLGGLGLLALLRRRR